MTKYNLVISTKFFTESVDGDLIGDTSETAMKIITLGQNGNTLLHELGRNISKSYNQFDIFKDGNTVKRFLTSNQWLVYWLKAYKKEIGENYETARVIQAKGVEFTGARIYATVTINNCTMIAEPVRRVEDFEIESNKQWLNDKIRRMSRMFDNPDQLYLEKGEKISFPQRPIIVLICEDDEHINEIWESVKTISEEIGEQEIWFSSDLRIFNEDNKGKRFLHPVNGELCVVDLKQIIGKDNETDATAHFPDSDNDTNTDTDDGTDN